MIKATLENGSVRYYSTTAIHEISHNNEGVLVAQIKKADGEVARIRLQSFCLLEAGESCA
jgi:hypothetical protein